jgi:hypothetical protein
MAEPPQQPSLNKEQHRALTLLARLPRGHPHGDGTGLHFETGEHGGDYPDNMPQAITVTDAEGRWAVYVPLRVGGKIVVPEPPAHSADVRQGLSPLIS